jgi:hypothetical protein
MDLIVELSALQKQLGVKGPVCEIGVHHGKLFILLHLLTEGMEISVAWDLFERQEENIDSSGRGDKARLRENLLRHGCDIDRVKVNSANSLQLTPEQIVDECGGKVRLFSIDGGHTAETTFNDLSLAGKSIRDGGVIVADDYFNEAWPGVSEGVCRYFQRNEAGLVPFAIGGNKLFITNDAAMAKRYARHIDRSRKGFERKKGIAFGNEVLIITSASGSLRAVLGRNRILRAIRDGLASS